MIYFCIPAYNEERTVGVVLWKLRQVMGELQRDYQIIVVDDASSDSTPAVLSPYIRVLPLTVIRNSTRRGYADSLEVALREAVKRSPYPKRDAVITLQADFTEDPDCIPAMVKRIEAGADVVATTVELEEGATRAQRWGRKLMHWLMRRREWAATGDPLSGLRAYRIVVLKRAAEVRGTNRLITWQGMGANVELLALTAPLSRRTDTVETTLKEHRLQRDTRFAFMPAFREVRAAASGKLNSAVKPLPTDGVIATPLPIVADHSTHRSRPGEGRTRTYERPRGRSAPDRGERGPGRQRNDKATGDKARPERERTARPERARRTERPRTERATPPDPIEATNGTEPVLPMGEEGMTPLPAKKRRRPRRRKNRPAEAGKPTLVGEQTESVSEATEDGAAEANEGPETPRKKSRRGRRGGRGRRRGPRNPDGTETNIENNGPGEGGGDAPPPSIAAEGD